MAADDENRYWADPALRERFFDIDPATGRYRRFFDIDDLAGVRQEDPEVFERDARAGARARARRASSTGCASTIPTASPTRPATCARLRDGGAERVWVEKILEPGERAARLAGRGHGRLRVPQRRLRAVRRPGRRGGADRAVGASCPASARPFAEVALEAKLEQARRTFAPEVERLRAARRDRRPSARRRRWRRCPSTAPTSSRRPGRVDRRRPRGDRGGRADPATARALLLLERRRRPSSSTRFQQTTPRGHGQGRRGHRLLPLRPAARAQRGRRRPGPLRDHRRATSTPRNAERARALPAEPARRPRPTTPSARPTCARGSARWPSMPERVGASACARWLELTEPLRAGRRARRRRALLPVPDARRRLADRARAPRGLHGEGAARGQAQHELGRARRRTGRTRSSAFCRGAVRRPARSWPTSSRSPRAWRARGERAALGQLAAQADRARACPTSTRATSSRSCALVDPDNRRPVDWDWRAGDARRLMGGAPPDARDAQAVPDPRGCWRCGRAGPSRSRGAYEPVDAGDERVRLPARRRGARRGGVRARVGVLEGPGGGRPGVLERASLDPDAAAGRRRRARDAELDGSSIGGRPGDRADVALRPLT